MDNFQQSMKIKFIGHSYHTTTGSSYFFIKILEKMGTIEFSWDEEWINPHKKLVIDDLESFDLIVVWQLPHIARVIPQHLKRKTVYVPMHDAVSRIGGHFWRHLRGMKILCLSYTNYVVCINYKLECMHLQYYPEPLDTTFPSFDRLHLFFWQRQSSPNWRTLSVDIPLAQFSSIHLHTATDPGTGAFIQPLECESRLFNIRTTSWFEDKSEYFRALQACNIFVAPRNEEGIGMALLEAMQRGMICIANNAPTMNEYIVHGMNGYLTPSNHEFPIVIQNDPEMSERVLAYMSMGYQRYVLQQQDLVDFLTQPAKPKYRKLLTPLLQQVHEKILGLHSLRAAISNCSRPDGRVAPKITVVTVVRNDFKGLARTIRSVAQQTYTDFEYLIWDGQSNDATRRLLDMVPESFAKVVVQRDHGPYDAMNKAAHLANGEFVLFLNAGDIFFSRRALELAMLGVPADADIIYGHHVYVAENERGQVVRAAWLPATYEYLKAGRVDYAWQGGIPCHQSTLTRRTLLLDSPYDWQRYAIAADHDFLYSRMGEGAKSHHTNTVIAYYYSGGLSAKNKDICVRNWRDIAIAHSENPQRVAKFYDQGIH